MHEFKQTKRMASVSGSGTLKLAQMASDLEQKRHMTVLKFTLGEPDMDTPEYIVKAAQKAMEEGKTHYTSFKGIVPLREAVAEMYQERGIDCRIDDVLITPTKMAIYAAIMTQIEKRSEVLVPDPAWVSYEQMVALAEGDTVYVDMSRDDGSFRIDEEKMKEAITPKSKMLIINTPSNPTGGMLSQKELFLIADLAIDNDLIVISDEVYENITYEGNKHVSLASIPEMFERTITVSGFSKSFAMTGWRVGWAMAPKEIMQDLWKVQQHSITCVTSFVQYGALEALRNKDEMGLWMAEMKRKFRERRKLVCDLFSEIPQVTFAKPQGAFYLFPRFDVDMTSEQLAEFLLYKARVATTPGSAFGPHGEGYLRLSYAASKKDLRCGIQRIQETLEQI